MCISSNALMAFRNIVKSAGPLAAHPMCLLPEHQRFRRPKKKLRGDLPFLDDVGALHVLGVVSKYSLLTPELPEDPQEI